MYNRDRRRQWFFNEFDLITVRIGRRVRPPLNIDQVVLATVFRDFKTSSNKSRLNQVHVVGGEVGPSIGQPLRHQHPTRHGAAASRVLQLHISTRRDPDIRIVLDGALVHATGAQAYDAAKAPITAVPAAHTHDVDLNCVSIALHGEVGGVGQDGAGAPRRAADVLGGREKPHGLAVFGVLSPVFR